MPMPMPANSGLTAVHDAKPASPDPENQYVELNTVEFERQMDEFDMSSMNNNLFPSSEDEDDPKTAQVPTEESTADHTPLNNLTNKIGEVERSKEMLQWRIKF
jgi:hypothetical protein